MKILPGDPYPLGARYDGNGVNFAIFSELAERVELCLFEEDDAETRINVPESSAYIRHVYLSGVGPGQQYGYRMYGPWEPKKGLRYCPTKLLLDPYCKAVEGAIQWSDAMLPYRPGSPDGPCSSSDNAALTHKCVVINPYFDWRKEHRPNIPLEDTIIYELHVKGFTKRHPDVPPDQRGTYAGLAHPAIIDYLKSLGITAVELMPVHQFVHDRQLLDKGLRNYWGYNSICFFAPHNEYSSTGQHGQQVQEFRQMVHDLHEADIEVILDVVYNHTAEGNHLGPMLSFKGIDNPAYYRLVDGNPQYYMDYTGTGNSLNMRHPHVLQLIMDSLRYWIVDMHVDGFRFDLAATLARELKEVDRLSAFFDIIQQDPIISQVKLIAEPWDVGEGGYQVGKFPPRWSEWNGIYRDTIRDYWRAQGTTLGQLAGRFTGSSDLYENTGRRPHASVNFVTAHDGFTLHDLVTYNEKHNEANLEGNKDGSDDNRSWNCGVEGETDDPAINDLRNRQKRNFLATLLLSQGMPMLRGGDEIGQTKHGNNNSYCQDNEMSWFDWEHADKALRDFTADLIALRIKHPVFRRRGWFQGRAIRGTGTGDIAWFRPDGVEMVDGDWKEGTYKSLQVFLGGVLGYVDKRGEPVLDDDFLILFNAHWEDIFFKPALAETDRSWEILFNTSTRLEDGKLGEIEQADSDVKVEGRSMVVLSRPRKQEAAKTPTGSQNTHSSS
ncbi:MAG: glycogen debranching protein GlgX [Solirubrobacterales bacterium]